MRELPLRLFRLNIRKDKLDCDGIINSTSLYKKDVNKFILAFNSNYIEYSEYINIELQENSLIVKVTNGFGPDKSELFFISTDECYKEYNNCHKAIVYSIKDEIGLIEILLTKISMKKFSREFIRWGTLGTQKHKESRLSEDKRGYHTAPVLKGIYAFPRGYIEPFLLGISDQYKSPKFCKNGRVRWLKDSSGNIITRSDLFINPFDYYNKGIKKCYKGLIKRLKINPNKDLDYVFIGNYKDDNDVLDGSKYLMIYYPKPIKFKYSGKYIWHHLDNYYSGDKIRLLVPDSEIVDRKGSWIKTSLKAWDSAIKKLNTIERWESYINRLNSNKSGDPHTFPRMYSNDHYEVFIEKV